MHFTSYNTTYIHVTVKIHAMEMNACVMSMHTLRHGTYICAHAENA